MVEELGRKQTLLLSMMDTAALTQPTPQQLAIAFGIITDKSLLYERQPTHIVTQEDRRAVDQVMLLLIKEARRRGIAIPKPPPQRHFASVEMAC